MKNLLSFLFLATIVFGQEKQEKIGVTSTSLGPNHGFEVGEMFSAKLGQVLKVDIADLKHKPSEFGELYVGNPGVLAGVAADNKVGKILVAKLGYSFRQSQSVVGDVVCDLTVTYKIFEKGEVVGRDVLLITAPGFSERNALAEAIERSTKQIRVP